MRFKAIVSYDGSNYNGFQIQVKGRQIQKEIEKAFKNMTQTEIKIYASGRTDKGVHAKGQVFHFDSDLPIEGNQFLLGVNKRLPKDIRLLKVVRTTNDFHARKSAKMKLYMYKISKKESSVFDEKYEAFEKDLDVNLMRNAAKAFIGTHDFRGFSKVSQDKDTIKTIFDINIKETKNYLYIFYKADGFLRYMARSITGMLIEIGKKRKSIDQINKVFETNDRSLAGKTAEAKGLYLMKVYY